MDNEALKFFESHIDDIDKIQTWPNLKNIAKKVVEEEINDKIGNVKVNPLIFCLCPVLVGCFIFGGVGASFMFPYNFAFIGLAFILMFVMICYICKKAYSQNKFFERPRDEMVGRNRQTANLD